jgi:hypothetical protein
LGSADADGVLIVDASVVADDAVVVEQENLGRALGTKAVGETIPDVLKKWEAKSVVVREGSNLGG